MSVVFVTNDTHLGKTAQNVDLSKEFDRYIDWLCKEAEGYPTIDDKILVVSGDFFDPKKSLTISQYKQATRAFNKLNGTFSIVAYSVGNHDVPGKHVLDDSLFDLFDWEEGREIVVKKLTRLTGGGVDLIICPYGHFEVVEPEGVTPQIYLTHENTDTLLGKTDDPILNGHVHTWSTPTDNIMNIGAPYQMEWGNVGNPGGCIVIDEGNISNIPYPRKLFRHVKLERGQIDGKNPVKWLTENRKDLEGTCLEVSVGEDTDKTLYSKFLGVLNTVSLADLKMIEAISFTPDRPMHSGTPNFLELLDPLVTRPGAKKKLEIILNNRGA
jgi:DNA repair exonuclease SbcCD nuclease subunit